MGRSAYEDDRVLVSVGILREIFQTTSDIQPYHVSLQSGAHGRDAAGHLYL